MRVFYRVLFAFNLSVFGAIVFSYVRYLMTIDARDWDMVSDTICNFGASFTVIFFVTMYLIRESYSEVMKFAGVILLLLNLLMIMRIKSDIAESRSLEIEKMEVELNKESVGKEEVMN